MPNAHRILIVDDSDEIIAYFTEVLEEHGYEYSVAQDGKTAIESMRSNRPDLVLLDVMMPRKSGIAVFNKMKKDPELAGVPIVIVTGASKATGVEMTTGAEDPKENYQDDMTREFGQQLREQLENLTPDGFLEKPVEPEQLIAKIRSLLG
ncbi:MAG: response regulator [Acidobacteria bacterium]|nr:response regulator [Acidobacteriota bacterium]